jgi:hypothetical protein
MTPEAVAIFWDYKDADGNIHDLAFSVPADRICYDFHSNTILLYMRDIRMEPSDESMWRRVMLRHSHDIQSALRSEYYRIIESA